MKPTPPTQAFLEEVVRRARYYGNDGDYPAVVDFVRHLYGEAGLPPPSTEELEPFPPEEGE